ncbi:amino acid adenylation domain-containing protein [Methylomonas sp. EFPC3]|uniref:non-ribosomal peptide synthetase n=1 Tax=Methylomonas sp. EFPC3 TaxID=3021710 RepID=UPI002415FAE2|nr:non-ribosomal peptide synthetase [Methylomonas sp. EFPC3]WFP48558.1 amino acid adenylation domain-containing protein [Methylomonas sp. EFPC3]
MLSELIANGARLTRSPAGDLCVEAGAGLLTDAVKSALKAEKAGVLSYLAGDKIACQSFSQERLWFLDRLGFGGQYHVPGLGKIEGPLDIGALAKALDFIYARHEALRTNFSALDSTPLQRIRPAAAVAIEQHDLSRFSGELQHREQKQRLQSFIEQPFNLETSALFRAMLLRLAAETHILALCLHHIVTDGWSMRVLLNDLAAAYAAFVEGKPPALPALPVDYARYAGWERETHTDAKLTRELAYWQRQLSGYQNLEMPLDFARPASASGRGAYLQFELSSEQGKLVKQAARTRKTTPFSLFMAAVYLLLKKYSGQHDICLGMPVANRNQREIEAVVGFFVNTVVMRINPPEQTGLTVNALLEQVHTVIVEGQENQQVPIEKIFDLLQPERDLSRSPLFQVLINYTPLRLSGLPFGNCRLEPLFDFEINEAKFELTFTYNEFEDEHALIGIEYAADLYRPQTVQRMAEHLTSIMRYLVESPHGMLAELELLDADAQRKILDDWSRSTANQLPDACLHDLFVRQALKTPEQVAVIGEESSLSYRELHEQSDRLAVYLQQLGVQADTIVAVCLRRSPLMLVGLLGILKAGGAYLPLDANTPAERSKVLLLDSGARLLLTEAGLIEGLAEMRAGLAIQTVALDSDWPLIAQSTGQPRPSAAPEHLAYVIYTSGSTGQPKGVMVEHRNVVNHNLAAIAAYRLNERDRVLQFSTISFDIFVEEVFPTLLSGGAVVMMDGERFTDVAYLKSLLQRHRVSLINLPTAYWHTLVDQDFSDTALSRVVIGGEKAEAQNYRAWRQRNPNIAVINTYGPTETTVISLLHPIDPAHDPDQAIPLGKPLANTQVYVLDSALKPVPIGVPGELHIAGAGVARGYLNQPELTAEKFIANPFGAGKLYKTGDLVRWLDDGNLAFIGRRDHQVKIRGFRVELGEIETALARHPAVKLPVLVVSERQNNKQLLAFYTHDGNPPEPEVMKAFLRRTLPDYMVPLAVLALDTLPMTPGGKIDRKALAQQAESWLAGRGDFSPPRGQLEQQLAEIWRALLNVERVGVNDNFFELGGHSLLTVQLISRINAILPDSSLNLADIFKYPTIKALSDYLERPLEKLTNSAYLLNLRSGIPTFIVPGMPGLSDGYFELAECLKREGPVYGLQMKGYSDEPPATTVEDMAAHNIAQIKSVWPQGRINLYAHSYGGTVVYEMLRQLQDSAYEIGEVVLIDSGLLLRQSSVDKASVKAFCNFMLTNAGISPEPYRGAIAEILKTKPYAEWKDCFASLLADIVPNLDAGHFRKIWQVTEASITARYRYTAKLPYRVTLVIAEGSKGWLAANEWDDYFQAVNVIKAKGEHFTVVKQPYCAAWLRELNPEPAAQPSTLAVPPLVEPDQTSSLLSVSGLEKHYGETTAVAGVSFELQAGTCFGLLGPNGAGKTSTLEMLEGILKPSKGDVLFRGKPIDRRYSQHIGIQFQHTALPETLTVKECLQLFQKLYPRSLPLDDIIEACALGDYINRDSRKLSGGQRQRLLLGIALINDPDILFLDEPTTGLDPQSRHNFWSLIRDIKQRGKTIVLTTHYMEEAEQLCDEIAIMDQGRIIVQDTPENLLQEHFDGVMIRLPRASGLAELPGLPFAVSAGAETVEFVTANVEAAIAQLTRLNISLEGLTVATPNLENLFLKLTGHSLRS